MYGQGQYSEHRQQLIRSLAAMGRTGAAGAGRTANEYGFGQRSSFAVDPRLAMLSRNQGENFSELSSTPQQQQANSFAPVSGGIGPAAAGSGLGSPSTENAPITGFGQPLTPPGGRFGAIGPIAGQANAGYGGGDPYTQYLQSLFAAGGRNNMQDFNFRGGA